MKRSNLEWINSLVNFFGTSERAMWVVANNVLNHQPVIGDFAVNNIPTFFTMKLMNEIESEFNAEIVEILVENGTPVEFGQVLMRVKQS